MTEPTSDNKPQPNFQTHREALGYLAWFDRIMKQAAESNDPVAKAVAEKIRADFQPKLPAPTPQPKPRRMA